MRLLLTLLFVLTTIPAHASICSQDAIENSKFWNVNPEALHTYTQTVVNAVQDRDMKKLISLIDGELTYGPRKHYLQSKQFDEIFPPSFRDEIIAYGPTCYVHSWRGITLGNGKLWIQSITPDTFTISSITDWNKETIYPQDRPVGWTVDGKLLTPDVFIRYSMNPPEAKKFAAQHHITSSDDFSSNPGKYFHKITVDTSIPTWMNDHDMLLRKAVPNKSFLQESPEGKTVVFKIGNLRFDYEVLAPLPLRLCKRLAPNLTLPCRALALIRVGEETGGTIGTITQFGIYGLFDHATYGKIIVPLKFFATESAAQNYLSSVQ